MSERRKSPKALGRREFLKMSLAAGVSLAAPAVFVRRASAQERVLKIVHWKHFVPDYDKWFDVFAKEFGETHKCKVEVDYVATADLPTAIAADISRRGGHDVFHLNGTGAWLYDNVLVDVTDVATKLDKEFGGWIPGGISARIALVPATICEMARSILTSGWKKIFCTDRPFMVWASMLRIPVTLELMEYSL